ncbi:DUF7010 family protein [Peribacillus muralis]|uniref:DUF7010 family protein n=1 Tax=Peribacillus muralis TaxID=264697 RepID=UPI00070A41B4|nr:hypothetical protein [Peribacillus muralis]
MMQTKEAYRGTGMGIIFMAFFGTMWAGVGVMGLQGWGFPYVELIAMLVGLILVIGGLSFIFAAQKMPNQASAHLKRIHFWFNIVFIAEALLIWAAIAICNATDQAELIPGIIAIIVGIHFLPLAALFKIKLYYVTGVMICLVALLTLLLDPNTVLLGNHQITSKLSLLGFGCALILWTTGITLWLRVKNGKGLDVNRSL